MREESISEQGKAAARCKCIAGFTDLPDGFLVETLRIGCRPLLHDRFFAAIYLPSKWICRQVKGSERSQMPVTLPPLVADCGVQKDLEGDGRDMSGNRMTAVLSEDVSRCGMERQKQRGWAGFLKPVRAR